MAGRFELRGLHRGGREFPVELTISAIESEGRREFHALLRDVSERAELVARLSWQSSRA